MSSQDKRYADQTIYPNGFTPDEVMAASDEASRAALLEDVHHGMTLPNREDVLVGRPGCQHCEVLPPPLRGPGVLHLRFPHTFTLGKILEYLAHSAWQHQEQEGAVSIHVPTGSLAPLLGPILDRMSSVEQRDTRAMFQPDDRQLRVSDFFEIQSLPRFVALARSDWLLDVLREQRLYSVFQPILRCRDAEPSKIEAEHLLGYECLMRAVVEEEVVTPGIMLTLARGAGLLFQLDLAARRAALTSAARYGITSKIFINFSPNAIFNPYSCLDSTVRMVDELGLPRERVVFEILESERLPEMAHLKRIIAFYRENGFGVALDDVGSGYSSLSVLLELRPDYVKLDMALVKGVHADQRKAVVVSKLLGVAQELGMQTIAEGIEDPADLNWVRDCGADYVQGYLFAKPAVPPPAPDSIYG